LAAIKARFRLTVYIRSSAGSVRKSFLEGRTTGVTSGTSGARIFVMSPFSSMEARETEKKDLRIARCFCMRPEHLLMIQAQF
jgi:hypothetical protein